jgi:hypothetical protein
MSQAFHLNVVPFGKQGHFTRRLPTGGRIEQVVQAQSQPDSIATLPLLTANLGAGGSFGSAGAVE